MKLISSFLEKSKNQPEIWIFYIFLLVLPFTIRKVIFFYPLGSGDQKTFNEYSGIYFYLSDLFIILLILFWIVSILYTKKRYLSIIHRLYPSKLWITCVNQYKKIDFNIIHSKTKHFFIKSLNFFKNVPSHSECSTCLPDRQAWNNQRDRRGTYYQLVVKIYNRLKKSLLILINKLSVLKRLFHSSQIVPRGTLFHVEHLIGQVRNIYKDKLVFIPSLLVFWSFVSIIWSDNHLIAFFRSLKILEFFLLYLYIKQRLFKTNCSTPARNNSQSELGGWSIWKNICRIFIFLGLFQAIIGIWQFFIQKSIGLFWLRESLINPEVLGVAKIIIGGEKYIRSYGLFPHPNILGGFLLLTIIITYAYKKTFSNIKNVPAQSECSTWNIVPRGTSDGTSVEQISFLRDGTFINIFLGIQIIGLLLTFSKSAIIGLFIAIIYIYINKSDCSMPARNNSQSELGGWNIKKLKYLFVLSFLLFGIILFYFKVDLYALFVQSIQERFIYLAASVQAIVQNMLWGLGNGQFVLEMARFSFQNLEFWQFQPVHNVFLLIFSELGMIGLFLFIWFILELFTKNVPSHSDVPRGTLFHVEHSDGTSVEQSQDKDKCSTWNIYLKSVLLGFIFVMIFDHYLWDIQQGSLMLWMIMGLIAVKK